MRQRRHGKPFPLLPFGFPEEWSLEIVLFITSRKRPTYGGAWSLIFGHKGASLLHVVQTVIGPFKQFNLPHSFWESDVPQRRESA